MGLYEKIDAKVRAAVTSEIKALRDEVAELRAEIAALPKSGAQASDKAPRVH